MVTDGLKAKETEERVFSLDIAKVVWRAMGMEEEKPPVDVCVTNE